LKVLIEDLSPAAISRIEENMRPGAFSDSGFLGPHERLVDVVRRDERQLAKLALTTEQIADRLESIVLQAYRLRDLRDQEDPGSSPTMLYELGIVEGRYEVMHTQFFGFQECPFENTAGEPCSATHGTDFHVRCRDDERELHFAGLAIHLIRDHHFFEGNVHYRIDPGKVAEFLQLEPGWSYAPEWVQEGEQLVPLTPQGEFLYEIPQKRSRPNEDAAAVRATPNSANWIRCPGCNVKIKVSSSSYEDGRHSTCGQRIQLDDFK